MRDQLQGFPDVHWAAVPFSLIRPRNADRDTDLDTTALSEAMSPFFGVEAGNPGAPGFLGSPAWKVLQKEARLASGATFFAPNPGVLYPAVQDLAERVLAAAKAVRPFEQTEQRGWRCSLTGETEWLTTDPDQLVERSYRSQTDTLWARVAAEEPAWAKKGEHLGALPAVKRLWPTLFAREVAQATGAGQGADRFVVSTHTMALAGNLVQLHQALSEPAVRAEIEALVAKDRAPALPRSLAHLRGSLAARIPAALDRLRESDEDESDLHKIEARLTAKDLLGHKPETYYALLMLDGDHMGRVPVGGRREVHDQLPGQLPSQDTHGLRQARQAQSIDQGVRRPETGGVAQPALGRLRGPQRVCSARRTRGRRARAQGPGDLCRRGRRAGHAAGGRPPARHAEIARGVQPETPARASSPTGARCGSNRKLVCKDGFAYLRGRLMRMMGGATASCGAVIAHHQAPLGAVLRELREAEQHAKREGGRDAFSLAVLKRSGGALHITAKWGESIELLMKLREFLAEPAVSRRAVYHSLAWLRDLPDDADPGMLGSLLGYQLSRQTARKTVLDFHDVRGLARCLAVLALQQKQHRRWLADFLGVAEFLAREVRSPSGEADDGRDPTPGAAAEAA